MVIFLSLRNCQANLNSRRYLLYEEKGFESNMTSSYFLAKIEVLIYIYFYETIFEEGLKWKMPWPSRRPSSPFFSSVITIILTSLWADRIQSSTGSCLTHVLVVALQLNHKFLTLGFVARSLYKFQHVTQSVYFKFKLFILFLDYTV